MDNNKFFNPDYKPDEDTKNEVENHYKEGKSLSGVQLQFADMKNINLINADLSNANLTRSDFSEASMYGANLEGANLFKTNLEAANLKATNMKNCNMLGADFTNAKLHNVDWGKDNKVINELEAEEALTSGDVDLAKEKYKESEDIYRVLKIALQAQSLKEETGKMFLREMIVKRKQLSLFSPLRLVHKFAHLAFGYGEKIGNIFYSILAVLVTCALLYGINGVDYQDRNLSFFAEDIQEYGYLRTFGNLFYFSVVVFSTVGFGDIAPLGLLNKTIVIFEGLTGGIILTIFIIAIYRQLLDR